MMGVFFAEGSLTNRANYKKVCGFLEIAERDRLSPEKHEIRSIDQLLEQIGDKENSQPSEDEDAGREIELAPPGFEPKFKRISTILHYLFPDSGIRNLADWPVILPYFDLEVFRQNLPFPEQVASMSRFDPMGQIMVLHRIVDNLSLIHI